jgi:hypothetical protein
VEATSFRVFGVDFTERDMLEFLKRYASAYDSLAKEDPKWESLEYCQKQIRSLFSSVMTYLNNYGLNGLTDAEMLHMKFIVDDDSTSFMRALSKMDWNWLFEKLAKVNVGVGQSFEIRYTDSDGQEKVAHGDWDQFLGRIRNSYEGVRSYSERIGNELGKFVEWVKKNTRPITNCIMLGGVSAIAIFANVWAKSGGNPLQVILALSIILVCLVASIFSSANDISSGLHRIRQNAGISLG